MGEISYATAPMSDGLDLQSANFTPGIFLGNGTDDEKAWWNIKKRSPDTFKNILLMLNIYFTPFIISIGLLGNVTSFLVFTLTHLKRQSSSVYLSALALVDAVFLVSLFVVWLSWVGVPLFHSNGWCQTIVYLNHVCAFLSVWNIALCTAERYIIVWHPLRKDRYCTPRIARRVVCVFTIFAIVLYLHTSLTSGVIHIDNYLSICTPFPEYYDVLTVLSTIDMFITLIIPFIIIIILNIRILIKIKYYQKQVHKSCTESVTVRIPSHHMATTSFHASVSGSGTVHFKFSNSRSQQANRLTCVNNKTSRASAVVVRTRGQYRTARMLLIVSSIFILLNTPSHVSRITSFVNHLIGHTFKGSKTERGWQQLFQLIYHLNFAINFFLYSACGRTFRLALSRLFAKLRHRLRRFSKLHCK